MGSGLFALEGGSRLGGGAEYPGPIDRVWTDVRDGDGLEADALFARSLGFRGKACVHPDQVEVVNRGLHAERRRAFSRARRVVEAYEQAVGEGEGVTALDGEMIDLPVVERARQLLALAERSSVDASDAIQAPKEWRGQFYEDFEVGDVFRSRLGRTITDTDNIWFTCLTMNTNQIRATSRTPRGRSSAGRS